MVTVLFWGNGSAGKVSDPAMPVIGINTKECKSGYNKDFCTPMFIIALFTIATLWKQPRCSTSD
jgi:hypothetical protein